MTGGCYDNNFLQDGFIKAINLECFELIHLKNQNYEKEAGKKPTVTSLMWLVWLVGSSHFRSGRRVAKGMLTVHILAFDSAKSTAADAWVAKIRV